MKTRYLFLLKGMFLLTAACRIYADPVVSNPSFEINTTEGGSTYQPLYPGFSGLPGWTFSEAPDPVLIGSPDTNYTYATPFGMWQVDITGSDNVPGGWIETIVTGLPSNGTFRVGFSLGTSVDFLGGVTSAPAVTVTATDNPPQTFTHSPTSANDRTDIVCIFAAPSNGVSTLRFSNASEIGIGFVAIDNVTAEDMSLPTVTMQTTGGVYQIIFTGSLEESTNLTLWSTVPSATNPYTVPLTTLRRFFRTRMD